MGASRRPSMILDGEEREEEDDDDLIGGSRSWTDWIFRFYLPI